MSIEKLVACPSCNCFEFDVSESYVYTMQCMEDEDGERELFNTKPSSYAGGLDDIVCKGCGKVLTEYFGGLHINWD